MARLRQGIGEPLDRSQLEQDIGTVYGLDYFESVDYEVVTEEGETGLLLRLNEKSWGTDNLKLGLNLVNDLDGDSQFNIGVSYRQKGLNRLGAEWFIRGQLGDTIILDTAFYQPLDIKSRFFASVPSSKGRPTGHWVHGECGVAHCNSAPGPTCSGIPSFAWGCFAPPGTLASISVRKISAREDLTKVE